MNDQDKRGWVIVGALFATLFLIWGPVNASGVFFIPVVKHFGWSRGFFSLLVATAPLAAGLSSPAAGWLMDRIGPRKVMIAGASLVALSYLALSRANSAAEFPLIFVMLGVGITASTIIPTALVITSWFRARRGLALGIAFAGIPLGGTGITILANYVVLHYGFRAGYAVMAIPIVVIVIPLLSAFIQMRAPAERGAADSHPTRDAAVPGLEVREAIRSRSFWMFAIAEALFATAGVGIRVHLVPYLTGLGYAPGLAAGIFGAMFIFSAIGSFAIGTFADRLGGRATLATVFICAAVGIAALFGAGHMAAVAVFILVFGLVRDTPPVLLPLAVGESLGVRRLGALLGIQALFTTIGFAAGPVIAGRVFDATGSYSGAFMLFIAMALVAAVAIRATLPLAEESSSSGMDESAIRVA
jgi:MFS family permease